MAWSTDTTIAVVTLLATGPSSILVLWKFFRNRRQPSHANYPLKEFEEPARSPSTNLAPFNLSRAGSDPHCLYPSGLDVEAGLGGLLVENNGYVLLNRTELHISYFTGQGLARN